MTTVMVVEDDPAFLNRFCRIVLADPEFELFAAVGSLDAARQATQRMAPDVLVTDLGLPDGNGIDLIREISTRYPSTDILVVTVFGDDAHVLASIDAGATGYIIKDSLPEEVVALIKQLVAGGSPISPRIARQLLERFKRGGGAPSPVEAERPAPASPTEDAGLTARESEVLTLVAKGFSFAEVARLLGMSPHTVNTHVKKIYQKLAVHSRGEAVYEAGKMGLL